MSLFGLPGIVKVGPLRYTVKVVADLRIKAEDMAYMESFRHEGEVVNLNGVHSSDDLHIEINEDQPVSLFRQTVVHEMLHALVSASRTDAMFDNSETEEKFVGRLAPWLTQLLQDNPRLIECITDRRQGGAGSATYWRRNS